MWPLVLTQVHSNREACLTQVRFGLARHFWYWNSSSHGLLTARNYCCGWA